MTQRDCLKAPAWGTAGRSLLCLAVILLFGVSATQASAREATGGARGPDAADARSGSDAKRSSGPPVGQNPAGGWETILAEGFEGAWPSPGWLVFDDDATDYGEYFWARRDCRAHSGSFSAWGVGGGADGRDLACGASYPNLAQSWMIYGPFDLSQAVAAEVRFAFWLKSECVGTDCSAKADRLLIAASLDGESFEGRSSYAGDWSTSPGADTGGWVNVVLPLQAYIGNPQVWVAWIFTSDATETQPGGAFIDDVMVRRWVGSPPRSLYIPLLVRP